MNIYGMSSRLACGALLTASLLILGCGGGDAENRVETYEVTGTITMNGQPLPNAVVSFAPEEDQPAAFGRTNEQGQYTLRTYAPGDGAAAGDYVVVVNEGAAAEASAPTAGPDYYTSPNYGQAPTTYAEMQKEGPPPTVIPRRYGRRDQSDLRATVTPGGENKFDFDLKP